MAQTGRIIEIFSSIQGEGLWVGRPQTFVRFHGCKLQCTYCDTPKTHQFIRQARVEIEAFQEKFLERNLAFSAEELTKIVLAHGLTSLAITGGEPLEQATFLMEWFNKLPLSIEILLETNGVEVTAYQLIADRITLVSMDLKLPSNSGEIPHWKEHRLFLQAMDERPHYAKVVFNQTMTRDEVNEIVAILNDFPKLTLYFQPESPLRQLNLPETLKIFHLMALKFPRRVRLVPQVHKSLGLL